mgnify:CR=1 FL=1
MKTRLDRAMKNEFSEDSSMENINKSIKIAKNMKIFNRLQNAETLEILDFEEYAGNMYPCS